MTPVKALSSGMINPMTPVMIVKFKESKMSSSSKHLSFSEFDDFYNANAPAINKLCDGDDGKDDETTAAASSWELVDTDDEKIFTRSKSGKRLKKKAKTTATASSGELVDTDDE